MEFIIPEVLTETSKYIIDPVARFLGEWSTEINAATIFLRIILSVLLAAIIGCERSSKRHSAGLRTFILVSLASTVAMMLDIFLADVAGIKFYMTSAASVIATAIISVNSMVFSSRNQIKGLTTSVGLWTCGIIGLTCGAGYYTVTLAAFCALLLCLSIFPVFERYLKNRSNHFEIHLELTTSVKLQDFVTTIRRLGLKIDDIELNPAYANSGLSVYSVSISISSAELKKYKTHHEIIEALKTLDYVYHIEEMHG
ncbi:MAG: MgtC/SapB family protein [Ruminococcaceae bacterium]|nr:MgtC/SapB family protein [Oscillospiraceae bacterium]